MKKTLISISSFALIAALSIATFATGVFAADAEATTNTSHTIIRQHQKQDTMSTEHFKTMLDELVKAGTITQADADEAYAAATADDSTKADLSKISDTVKEALKSSMQKINMLGCNTLTEEQTAKITSAVKSSFESTIAALVQDGTITQAQADQIISNAENMANRYQEHRGDKTAQTETQSSSTGLES